MPGTGRVVLTKHCHRKLRVKSDEKSVTGCHGIILGLAQTLPRKTLSEKDKNEIKNDHR